MSNICDYRPMINLSLREINRRFDFIHRYLCYLASGGAGGAGATLTITQVATSPFTLPTTLSNTIFTNEGAEDIVEFVLPPASPGLVFTFVRSDSDGVSIIPDGTNTIRIDGSASGPGDLLQSTGGVGDVITLVAVNSNEWIALSQEGTWTFITPP